MLLSATFAGSVVGLKPLVVSTDSASVTALTLSAPSTLAGGVGYRSPSNAMCVHPALKTRLLEHSAYDNSPGANPAYAGGTTPYQWNHSLRSRSLALFFDGSVRLFGTSEAMKAEARAGGAKLWLRNTPLFNGYGEGQSHDFFVKT